MNPEKIYPQVGKDVYWQRDVKEMYIFSEKTGESVAGNITAGRIIELSDGTRSIKKIEETLMEEFVDIPSEEEVSAFVTEFLSECEKKGLITFRTTPVEAEHKVTREFTSADVKEAVEKNIPVIIDEKASFDTTEEGNLVTYSVKRGKYMMLSEEEKEILTALLDEKSLQEILSDISQKYDDAEKVLTDFVCELLNYGLATLE